MTGSALAVLAQIRFYDGTKIPYDVPRSTMDPRFRLCANHHPACDCREAELSEAYQEALGEAHEAYRLSQLAKAIAQLHRRRRQGSYWRSQTGREFCASCGPLTAWPCPTLTLVAAIDYTAQEIAEETEVPW